MPIAGLGLHVIVALFFAVHVVRTRQENYWLFILFSFPFLGSVVYGLTIWLPDVKNTHHGYRLKRKIINVLDPQRELREAKYAFEGSATIDTHLRLANALLATDRAEESVEHYRLALVGLYENAPDILLNYADALYQSQRPLEAKQALDKLRAANPDYQSESGHLLYAQALSALNQIDEARSEFDALVDYHPSLEVYLCYAQALINWGENEKARLQVNHAEERIKRLPKHARRMNSQWIREIKKLSNLLN